MEICGRCIHYVESEKEKCNIGNFTIICKYTSIDPLGCTTWKTRDITKLGEYSDKTCTNFLSV